MRTPDRFYTADSAEHIASLAQEQHMPYVRSQILAEMVEYSEHITLFSTADGDATMIARPDAQYEAFTGV